MNRDYDDYPLKDIPKEFLKNQNNSNYKNTNDIYISSNNEVYNSQNKSQSSFDNIWLLLIFIIIFDLL